MGVHAQKDKGIVLAASFSLVGGTQQATVAFAAARDNADYTPAATSDTDGRVFTFPNQTINGFDIDTGSAVPLTGNVKWFLID